MTYIQCNFCSSMVDADLYLLQILATQLPAVNFLTTTIEKYALCSNGILVLLVSLNYKLSLIHCFFFYRFHISEWLSFFNSVDQTISTNDSDSETPMVESFLQFLATLCSNRTNLG